MQRTQILLDPKQYRKLKEIAQVEKLSVSEVIRKMLDQQIAEYRKQNLKRAALALAKDYKHDSELTAFQALNGEDFHA